MSFLHDSCTILHQFLQDLAKNCANLQVIILAASLAKSCTISCKICARLVQEKGVYNQWTGLVDWTSGLDKWTDQNKQTNSALGSLADLGFLALIIIS